MHVRGPKWCPPHLVGTPLQTIKVKRGGVGRAAGAGPLGYRAKPARLLSRALADMAMKYRKVSR